MSNDAAYKRFFSHRVMISDLLRGFLPADWVGAMDLESLEPLRTSFVNDKLDTQRHSDLIWRLRWGKSTLYVVVLVEFQSQSDRLMATRIGAYVNLLYQDLVHTGLVGKNELLPPLLPLVLFSGGGRWTAPITLSELVAPPPPSLARYQVQASYLLIEETRFADAELSARGRNFAAALFRLEKSATLKVVREVIRALAEWLRAPEDSTLHRAFAEWVMRELLPRRLPGIEFPEFDDVNLFKVSAMLDEQVVPWTEQWKEEGKQEGRQEGRQEERELLLRLVRTKFDDACAERLSPFLQRADTAEQFGRIGEGLIRCADAEAFLRHVESVLA